MIGIIGAMKIEIEKINEAMEEKREARVSGILFTSGKLYGKDVVTAVCGIGKVFAAICAEAMILKYEPDIIINTGVAGALADDLDIGDIVISESVLQHDMDTSPLGDAVGLISGINIINIPSDEKLAEKVKNCVSGFAKARLGVIASGDKFIASEVDKARIKTLFGADACEMEGGAIGHAAYVNGVKFVVVRAISDKAHEHSAIDYPAFAKKSAEICAEAVKLFVKES